MNTLDDPSFMIGIGYANENNKEGPRAPDAVKATGVFKFELYKQYIKSNPDADRL